MAGERSRLKFSSLNSHEKESYKAIALFSSKHQWAKGRGRAMKGSLSHELDVAASAGEVWEVYGTLRLAELVPKLLSGSISKLDVEQGDGGVGTVLCATLNPDLPGSKFYKEKFVTVDNERRVKEATVIEGGFLDLGFSSYLVRFEILEKTQDSSTIRSTIEYEIGEENAASASFVNTGALAVIAEGVAKLVQEKKATSDV